MDQNARCTFNPIDAEALLQGIGNGSTPNFPQTGRQFGPFSLIAKNGGSAIAARSGSSISSQDCTIYYVAGGVLSSSGVTVPVYNMSSTAVAADAYIIAAKACGVWVAVWEDC